MPSSNTLPISVQDLLRNKREDLERQKKPIFLSKIQRERLSQLPSNSPKINKDMDSLKSINKRSLYQELKPTTKNSNSLQAKKINFSGISKGSNQLATTRKKKHEKFKFEWNSQDDTVNENDPLYELHIQKRERNDEIFTSKDSKKKVKSIDQNVHWSKKSLDKMNDRDWRNFKSSFGILTKGTNIPNPIRFWQESSIPKELIDIVNKLGYKDPTPIQRASIPIALTRRDVIGVAKTGSGKTASFIIPLLTCIMSFPILNEISKINGPYAIVLVPTRELAQQIQYETKKFCEPLGFRCASVVGGRSIEEQAHELQQGVEILIATPGRLDDLIERRIVVLSQCCYVVMDEADRMIDFGFEPQVKKILDALPLDDRSPESSINMKSPPEGRKPLHIQTMMYTATLPSKIEKLADTYLKTPAIVKIGNIDQVADKIEQHLEFINTNEKRIQRLLTILKSRKFHPPVIIFANTHNNCDMVSKSLKEGGWNSVVMHGGKSQEKRELSLSQLRSGVADCLVATGVAARGIDIPNVSLVVNFQMPISIEEYTHRIGRTGRAGKSGVAITFLGPEDSDVISELVKLVEKSGPSKIPEDLRRFGRKQNIETWS